LRPRLAVAFKPSLIILLNAIVSYSP